MGSRSEPRVAKRTLGHGVDPRSSDVERLRRIDRFPEREAEPSPGSRSAPWVTESIHAALMWNACGVSIASLKGKQSRAQGRGAHPGSRSRSTQTHEPQRGSTTSAAL